MPDVLAGAALAIHPGTREQVPEEHLQFMLRSYLDRQNPGGVRDITFEWRWADEFSWEDEDGERHIDPAHWVLFAEGTVSV